jgi:ABC-type Mn2+/Zn2+ transport system permease subunit
MNWLVEPLSYAFMQRGLAAAVMVGIICAVVGCYVVLRSMAFLGDAMAHSILPGVAVAYLLGANLTLGALAAAILVALGIGLVSRKGVIREDTSIGILFAAALSLGVVLMSTIRTYAIDLSHILFGNVLGVTPADLVLTGIIGVVVIGLIAYFFKEFMVISFDPVLATTIRIPVALLRYLMLILLAATIVISMQTVGIGLVAAMLITPAATAYLLTRRLVTMMLTAAVIGAISAVIGLYASFYINVASGAAVVLTATIIFMITYILSPRSGLIRRRAVELETE